jgi:hypothetical protein
MGREWSVAKVSAALGDGMGMWEYLETILTGPLKGDILYWTVYPGNPEKESGQAAAMEEIYEAVLCGLSENQ